jgi:nanoRNase/pAp phosphatase (c-di-AMP/oligoRNAs hydrolase)
MTRSANFSYQEFNLMANITKYRLLTRSDLDGLICAVLLKHLDMVDEIKLIDHPGLMQEGDVAVSDHDIITNLPFVHGVHLAIDHHVSESLRNQKDPRHIIKPDAPSAARVVYEYFGGKGRFPALFDEMMDAVDKADSGQFSQSDVLYPKRWVLLNFLVDQRTGIEQWGNFQISEERLKLDVIEYCSRMPIDDILSVQNVKERANVYFKYESQYKNLLRASAAVHQNIVVLDFRRLEKIYPGNRFIIYALYPECNISILIRSDAKNNKTIFSIGKSILNHTSTVNIGELMLAYGGGGHRAAGACHIDNDKADHVFEQLLRFLKDAN